MNIQFRKWNIQWKEFNGYGGDGSIPWKTSFSIIID